MAESGAFFREGMHLMHEENELLKKHLESIQFDFDAMAHSLSFRLGRNLTYPGRMVRDRLKQLRPFHW